MSGIPTPPHQKPTVSETQDKEPTNRGAPRDMTPDERKAFVDARKRRNIAIALGLVTFAVLIFVITALRLAQNIAAGA